MAVWGSGRCCGATLSSLPPLPSPHDLVFCFGRGVSRATVRSGGSGSSVVVCDVGMWAAAAPTAFAVVRVPAVLARRSGCCQGWSTGGAGVRRVVLPLLGRDRGPSRRWWRSALLCDCCGNRCVIGPLDGSVWVGWAAAAVEVCFVPGSWPDVVLGVFLGESLSDGDAPGRCFPC
jgi:hypothetical protein